MRSIAYIVGLAFVLLTTQPLKSTPYSVPQWTVEEDSLAVYYSDNRLTIEHLKESAVLEIYNIMGRKVYSRSVAAGTTTLDISLTKGIYIIRLGKYTKKIAVR